MIKGRSFLATSALCAALLAACSPQRQPQPEPGIDGTEAPVIEEERPVETGAVDPETPAVPPGRPAGEPTEPRPAAAAGESVTGRVAITGSAPFPLTTLMVEDGPAYRLMGDLEPELRNLAGATVRVEGTPVQGIAAGRLPGPAFEVQAYEIVAIDGQRPQVGTLAARNGVWWLEGADRIRLAAVPEGLREQEGAKVWIVGRQADGSLQIQSYGIIREP